MEETTNERVPSDRELAELMCGHAVRLKEALDGLAVLWSLSKEQEQPNAIDAGTVDGR